MPRPLYTSRTLILPLRRGGGATTTTSSKYTTSSKCLLLFMSRLSIQYRKISIADGPWFVAHMTAKIVAARMT